MEKNDLERALGSVSEILENTVTEKEQLAKLLEDFKAHFKNVKE
jgi:predicted nuclease with TOPRIM domain